MIWSAGWMALAMLWTAQDNDSIWSHFEEWVRSAPVTSGRAAKPVMELYADRLAAEGVAREEADRRAQLITNELRPSSRARSIVYWDAMFKFGAGPDRPLQLLRDTVRELPAGDALDAAMGNGRNGLYLATLGWRVTGYDIAPEGIARARERAAQLSARMEMVQAGHREFEFGVNRWDLIMLSYLVADTGDLETVFGEKLWNSLREGGRVVCEGYFCEPLAKQLLPLGLNGLRLEFYSDREELRDSWVADNSRGRVVRAVIRKLAPGR